MGEPPGKRNPATGLTDELLIEILSLLSIRSICRFKCVSWSWRNLISNPDHHKKLPQTLVGFFYESLSGERFPIKAHHFTNVTGKGIPFIFPSFSFSFLPSLAAGSSSQIPAMASSSTAAFSLVLVTVMTLVRSIMLCEILRPRSGLYCRMAAGLVARLALHACALIQPYHCIFMSLSMLKTRMTI
jgi:hypothetical protein